MDTTENLTAWATNDISAMMIEETGRGTVNTITQVTATSRGRGTGIIRTISIAIRITIVIDILMGTRIAAQAATATVAPLAKGRTISTATTGTTGVSDPITTGIKTPREDVLMNSVPTTTREETALSRTSGGCRITGQRVNLGKSTTAGPSTPTNLLRCWTLAPRRLRSPHMTPTLQSSDLQTQTQRQTRTGTTGRVKVLTQKLCSPGSKPHTADGQVWTRQS